jgi:DNA ligase-1
VFPGLIPKFELQQCHSLDKGEELKGDWYVEPKLDGLRAVLIFEKGVCKDALSRNGRPLYNMGHIIKEITDVGFRDGVLDGEVYGKNWYDTISAVRASKSERDVTKIRFVVFDYIPIKEWNSRQGKMVLSERKKILEDLFRKNKFEFVDMIEDFFVKDAGQAWELAKEFKKEGYEGAVAKRVDSVYEFDRSYNWLKLKFEEHVDLVIVGMDEGGGKNKGRLGAFICKTGKGDEVNVGGGFSDEQRDEIWKHKKKYIGRIVEVKCQEKTKDGSLRFPVVVSDEKGNIRFRDDKE